MGRMSNHLDQDRTQGRRCKTTSTMMADNKVDRHSSNSMESFGLTDIGRAWNVIGVLEEEA